MVSTGWALGLSFILINRSKIWVLHKRLSSPACRKVRLATTLMSTRKKRLSGVMQSLMPCYAIRKLRPLPPSKLKPHRLLMVYSQNNNRQTQPPMIKWLIPTWRRWLQKLRKKPAWILTRTIWIFTPILTWVPKNGSTISSIPMIMSVSRMMPSRPASRWQIRITDRSWRKLAAVKPAMCGWHTTGQRKIPVVMDRQWNHSWIMVLLLNILTIRLMNKWRMNHTSILGPRFRYMTGTRSIKVGFPCGRRLNSPATFQPSKPWVQLVWRMPWSS